MNRFRTLRTRPHFFERLLLTGGLFFLLTSPLVAGGHGADVTVFDLQSIGNYGADGDYVGYSVGTTSCNIGDEPLWWCDNTIPGTCTDDQHPVIAQNVYRLKNDRFEQIGMSWLKHGFLSVNNSAAGCGDGSCDDPPEGGDQLGVGCTDPYGSGLNGSRPLGMRSEVQATSGQLLEFPYTSMGSSGDSDQRAKVLATDVDPSLNPGARYWIEGHYIAADDAAAGNALNNASYQEVTVGGSPSFSLSSAGLTVREQAAIFAWQAVDASVEITNYDFDEGGITVRFHVARKVIENGPNDWHYEYAVHNMNSDNPARAFSVQFDQPASITNVGFHDIDHHSGETDYASGLVYDTTDWEATVDGPGGLVTWSSVTSSSSANALRWGTLFSFWFDSDLGPDQITGVLIEKLVEPLFQDGFESGNTSAW